MIEIMTREQAKTFREQQLLKEQRKLAEQGISSAFEGKFLVTIGDSWEEQVMDYFGGMEGNY